MLLFAFAEISPTKRPEEKESCEVWNGWHDYRLADLYCLVPTALHVFNQICCRHHEQASRCINHNNSRRLSGKKRRQTKRNIWFCTVFPCAVPYSLHRIFWLKISWLMQKSDKLTWVIPFGLKTCLFIADVKYYLHLPVKNRTCWQFNLNKLSYIRKTQVIDYRSPW